MFKNKILIDKKYYFQNCIRNIPFYCSTHLANIKYYDLENYRFCCKECETDDWSVTLIEDIIQAKLEGLEKIKYECDDYNDLLTSFELNEKEYNSITSITNTEFTTRLEANIFPTIKSWPYSIKKKIRQNISDYYTAYQNKMQDQKLRLETCKKSLKKFTSILKEDIDKLNKFKNFEDYTKCNLGEMLNLDSFDHISELDFTFCEFKSREKKLHYYKIKCFDSIANLLLEYPVLGQNYDRFIFKINKVFEEMIQEVNPNYKMTTIYDQPN